jgi:Protein of unknown function (DUF3606)
MPEDLTRRSGQERGHIHIDQQHEVRDWAARFGVTREQLKEAVEAVGDRADEVERHLRSIAAHAS